MRSRIRDCVYTGLFVALCSGFASAGPTDSILLSLIPPGPQVLSGFANKANQVGGPLLMTTRNNVHDLADWRALAGVDPGRVFTEIIEVAFAPDGTALKHHLLLAAGAFHRDRIFAAAELNGAKRIAYLGIPVLTIDPFSREKNEMTDTRWLAVLDERVVAFGTPPMVQQ